MDNIDYDSLIPDIEKTKLKKIKNDIYLSDAWIEILERYDIDYRKYNSVSALIFDIEETDSEVLFKFSAKHDDKIISLLKPKTLGASISPFSSKNLPRDKNYKIPDEVLKEYKDITSNLPTNKLILVGKYTNNFIKSLATKKNTYDDIKNDMALKGLKGKEYIHSIGLWDKYIDYLRKEF